GARFDVILHGFFLYCLAHAAPAIISIFIGGSSMKLSRSIAIAVGAGLVLAMSGQVAVQGQEPSQIGGWPPLPVKPNPFVPPHKPWTKLSDVLAKHKGQQNWSELIVDDNLFHGEYISMAPGAKTPRRFHQDNRAFWIVQDGQIRFTIEG